MRYPVILMDPPWPYRVWSKKTGQKRSAESHYRTMEWAALHALKSSIDAVAADTCALCIWVCRPSMPQAISMILDVWNSGKKKKDQWHYGTELFTWVKTTKAGKPAMGMGHYTRANTEPVLLFTKGRVRRLRNDIPQVVLAPRLKHSEKPEMVQDRLERLFDGPYLELFARRHRLGWTCMGWELDGVDITESLTREVHRETKEGDDDNTIRDRMAVCRAGDHDNRAVARM